jgi:hypothetical protein
MDDLIERLRKGGEGTARATQMLADAKSHRNQAAGDQDACYMGLTPEQTVEWKAADLIAQLRDALYEIANRASNMMDDDAAEWMPSIYKIACEATGEDPWPLLRAAGHTPPNLTVGFHNEQNALQKQEAR